MRKKQSAFIREAESFRLLGAVLTLLVTVAPGVSAQEGGSEPAPQPAIFLGTEHGGSVVHDRALPLLLRVRLGNPVASNVQIQNELAAEEVANTSETAAKNNRPSPVPSVTLLSSGNVFPLSFDIRDATGGLLSVTVRPLRETQSFTRALVLDGTANPEFDYGIDPTELAALAPGKYFVRAILSRKDAPAGESSGNAQSAPLTVTLRASDLSAAEQIVDVEQAGRFYLHDRNYEMAEKQAATLLQLDKISVSAWELRGDAFVEQGKLDDAERAFKEALRNVAKHSDNVPPPLREPPEWLYERLARVRELKQRAGR